MTKERLREIRAEALHLTRDQFAAACGLGPNGHRTIARYETGAEPISGPIANLAQAFADGWRPPHLRAGTAGQLAAAA